MNSVVGGFQKNAKTLVNAYRAALDEGAECVVSPLGSLVGYPIGGLGYKAHFIAQSRAVLEEMAKEIGEVPLVVGVLEEREGLFSHCIAILYRREGLLQGGEHRELGCLSRHDPTQEFWGAPSMLLWEFQERKLGFVMGDHLFKSSDIIHETQKVDVLICLTAMPYLRDLDKDAEECVKVLAKTLQKNVIFCNAVGGSDDRVCKGESLAVSSSGDLLVKGEAFAEQTIVVDPTHVVNLPVRRGGMETLYEVLVLGVRDFVCKSGFRRISLGFNDDINSIVMAMVAREALGNERVKLYATTQDVLNEGGRLRGLLREAGLDQLSLSDAALASKEECLQGLFTETLQQQITALRLIQLSESSGKLLLSTVDKSDLMLGAYGHLTHVKGSFAPLGDLYSTLVEELAGWIFRKGSYESEREYEAQDRVLKLLIERHWSADKIVQDKGFEESFVRGIQRKIDRNRRFSMQMPLVLKVHEKSVREKLIVPIGQRYQG